MSLTDTLKRRFGRRLLLGARPLRDRRRDEPGRCSVCGSETTFAFNSWVIPDDLREAWGSVVADAYTRRESMFCRTCCSSLRVRGFADVLLELYGSGSSSIAELVEDGEFRRLDVAEINTIGSLGSLHAFLARLPKLAFSEYRGPERLGELVDGVPNEDITKLTYADASFDLVLSSDTIEHVPDFRAALQETRRVLRPGGRHVFTVPIVGARDVTEPRAHLAPDGTIEHLLPPLFHGRGAGLYRLIPVGEDMLAFTEFGRDFEQYLREAGFEVSVFPRGHTSDPTGASLVFAATAGT